MILTIPTHVLMKEQGALALTVADSFTTDQSMYVYLNAFSQEVRILDHNGTVKRYGRFDVNAAPPSYSSDKLTAYKEAITRDLKPKELQELYRFLYDAHGCRRW